MLIGFSSYFIRGIESDIHYIPEVFAYYFEDEIREVCRNIHEAGRNENVFLLKKENFRIILSNNLADNSITIQFEGDYKPKDIYRILDIIVMNVLLDDTKEQYEKQLYIDCMVYEKIIHDISNPKHADRKYRYLADSKLSEAKDEESFRIQSTIVYDNGFNISNVNFVVLDSFLHTYMHELNYLSGEKIGTKEDGYNVDLIEYAMLLQQRIYECVERNFTDDYVAQLNMK